MRTARTVCAGASFCLCIGLASTAAAQQPAADAATAQALRAAIDQLRADFTARLTALEAKLAAISAETAAAPQAAAAPPTEPAAAQPGQPTVPVPPGAEGAGGPSGSLPVYGTASAASKIFNPDIAVIGNFVGVGGNNDVRPGRSLEMREAEASFQAVVDPYARADFFMAFAEEGVDLEEGFITFPTVPGGLLVKVGKMRSAFGKVNTFHTHQIPWPDRPLVTENLVGGEEGIADAGVSAARLIPNPWLFLEATGQVYRGDSGDIFAATRRGDLSYAGHLRGYHDITESTNVDVGGSVMLGHTAPEDSEADFDPSRTTTLYGIDATVRWRPLQRSIYRSFVGRSEVVWSRRERSAGRIDSSGFYVSGDYQLARRWFAGARLDQSDRLDEDALRDKSYSALITFWPSEFSQLRGQYRRTNYADGPAAHEFLFQLQFSIGAHGAHPF
jgi:hypothetical protein